MPEYRRSKEGNTFFFTVVTYQRQPFLCLKESRQAFEEISREVKQSHPFEIMAWVVIPDHLHAIWQLPDGDFDFSIRWALIKKGFSKRFKDLLPAMAPNASRLRKRESAVWQRRFWEHQIRDEDDFRTHFDYIHYNPIKHGLVKRPGDWPHSSFMEFQANGIYSEGWGCTEIEFGDNIGNE